VTFKTLLLMGGVSLGILGGLAFEAEALTFKERRIVNAMLTGLIPPDAVSDQVIREYLDMLRRDAPLSQQIQQLEEILRQRQAAEAEAPAAAEVGGGGDGSGGGGGSRALSEEEQLERAKDESLKEAAEAAREEEQLEMVKAESLVEADEAKAIAEAVSEAEAKVAAAEAKSAAPRDPKAKNKDKKRDGLRSI
jgi:hypothetical protein